MADRRRRRRRASQDSEDDEESGSGSDSGRSGSPATKSRGRDPDPAEATACRAEAKSDVESECVSSGYLRKLMLARRVGGSLSRSRPGADTASSKTFPGARALVSAWCYRGENIGG